MLKKNLFGFTLAELLIALAILGVIATFTIPKILQAQSDSRKSAIVKETAATIASLYQEYKTNNTVTGTTSMGTIMLAIEPKMNYIKRISPAIWSNAFDDPLGDPWTDGGECSNTVRCYILPSGALLTVGGSGIAFGGTSSTNAVRFLIDVDGGYNGDRSNSIWFFLYYNGRVTHYGSGISADTTSQGGDVYQPNAAYDPPWFSW